MRIDRITIKFMTPPAHPCLTPETAHPSPVAPGPGAATGSSTCPRWRSSDLMEQGRLAEIEHAGQLYRLRITALGKLILTK